MISSSIALPEATRSIARSLRADRTAPWFAGVGLAAILLFALTLQRFGHTTFTVDAHLYYAHAHSWYFDGDLDYGNNIAADPGLDARDIYLSRRGLNGRVLNIFPCGWSLLALPWVAAADAVTRVHNLVASPPLPRDGFTGFYAVIVPLGHVFAGLVGLWAAFVLAGRYFSRPAAARATALVFLGTNVFYFISVEPAMSHAASLCCVGLTLLAVDTIHRRGWTWRRAAALGAAAGMMCAVRHQDAAWLVVPAVLLGLFPGMTWTSAATDGAPDRARMSGTHAVLAAGCFAACLVPQVLVNLRTFGTWTGGAAAFTPDWMNPQFGRDLWALPGGLFVFFPLTFAGTAGLLYWVYAAPDRRVAAALSAGLLACVYLNACGIEGTARRYVCTAPALIMGLCAVEEALRRRPRLMRVAACIMGLLIVKNALLLAMTHTGRVDRHLFTSVIREPTPLLSALLPG